MQNLLWAEFFMRYAQENSPSCLFSIGRLYLLGRRCLANVMIEETGLVRHNPQRLAGVRLVCIVAPQ